MGSAEGAIKAAAARTGCSVGEYIDNTNRGLLWCTRDQDWEPAENFAIDRTRLRGRASSCKRSNNAAARRRYQQKNRPSPGRRYVAARPGDKLQARRRVNHLVDVDVLPNPNEVPCTDCGHLGSDKRHEYDHHLGYDAEHHEDVEPVCSTCHHERENQRG